MGIQRVEFDENGSEEEVKEVLLAIERQIKKLEENTKGKPGWEKFGEKGEYFFAIPTSGWNEDQLDKTTQFAHEVSTIIIWFLMFNVKDRRNSCVVGKRILIFLKLIHV